MLQRKLGKTDIEASVAAHIRLLRSVITGISLMYFSFMVFSSAISPLSAETEVLLKLFLYESLGARLVRVLRRDWLSAFYFSIFNREVGLSVTTRYT